MKLGSAITLYVEQRRNAGTAFVSSERVLRALCRNCGDIELGTLTARQVQLFVSNPERSGWTNLSQFSIVHCFASYWSDRGRMPALQLARPSRPRARVSPFIYTRPQIRDLLRQAQCQCPMPTRISGSTLRMILLTLYATGASVGEVSRLRREDADVKRGYLSLRATPFKRQRTIPLQNEFKTALATSIASQKSVPDSWLFQSVDGTALDRHNLHTSFHRLHASLGIKARAEGRQPRLQDLRFTFAVHRLADAVKRKEELSELIPALSTYMGYTSLTKAEEFLAYVPERFSKDLQKLRPLGVSRPWRESEELLTFLKTI